MGLFNNRFHSSAGEKEGKVYRILTTIALVGIFVAVGILVVGLAQNFITAGVSLVLGLIATICLSIILCLPWIKKLENNKYRITSIVFLAIIGLCALLWLISCIVIFVMYQNAKAESAAGLTGGLRFLQVVLILTIQFICAQTIATTIINYQRNYIVFQVIMYISNVFVDLYVTCFLLCIAIKDGTGGSAELFINDKFMSFLFTPAMYTLFALFFVYTAICSGILNRIQRGKQKIAAEVIESNKNVMVGETDEVTPTRLGKEEIKSRLENLKDMLDGGLITQEEYDAKREEILKEI